MTRPVDEKGLANETLPAPDMKVTPRATSSTSPTEMQPLVRAPRNRTADHLKSILAAAGVVLVPQMALGDATVPTVKRDGSNDKPGNGHKVKPGGKSDDSKARPKPKPKPKPPRPPEDLGYHVVDMMPEPADIPPPPPPRLPVVKQVGYLDLASLPSAAIRVDGRDTGLTTPQKHIKLDAGVHAVSLIDAGGRPLETFTVQVEAGLTVKETRDLRPRPGPPK